MPRRIFLLSPAHCGGKRAGLLYRPEARFELALQLRTPKGATLGKAFSFMSGLYFRGKLAYAQQFADPPADICGQLVITTHRGLLPADSPVTLKQLQEMGEVAICADDPRYRKPLVRTARQLRKQIGGDCEVVLLGSVASGKYVDVLGDIFGGKLLFPSDFVGRGDMSRGGLLLRCVEEGRELAYVPVNGATRRGQRPPKLAKRTFASTPPVKTARPV